MVPETCPIVNEALENITAAIDAADDSIKAQTGALRSALIDALDRALDAEAMVEQLKFEIEALKAKVDDFEKEQKS